MSDAWPDYELIDFGEGRKLERFGEWLLDRPAPGAADFPKAKRSLWSRATARFEGERAASGAWLPAIAHWPVKEASLPIELGEKSEFRLRLRPLPSGQIGVFPEQLPSWLWIAEQVRRRQGLKVLNLFAYTGGSTLAAAVSGAEVAHVDAARSVVNQARDNATSSGIGDRPIRWIVEDAIKFCTREVKRGNRYDAIILDPPTYGHGPKGEQWLIKRDLLPLLQLCGELTERRPKFVLLTCHTPGIGPAELSAYLCEGIFGACGQPPRTGELYLESADGRRLSSGWYARWP